MKLTKKEQKMLEGRRGNAAKKSMEILCTLGEIYGAEEMVPVSSVQVAGVSYDNLGDAGLEYLNELATDGKVKVFTTLNPAGMDLKEWKKLGISDEFAEKQLRVIDAFKKMGIATTCTCTPYLAGNLPRFAEHIAWSESSAVAFANSVLGARTNREGGPSALAAALTGRTPCYGMHLDENRQAQILVKVRAKLKGTTDFGALGEVIGNKIGSKIPLITGVKDATMEELKSLSASIATYGGTSLFHVKGITPNKTRKPSEVIETTASDLSEARKTLNDEGEPDFVGVGCPHASVDEIRRIAEMLRGKKVLKEFWICTSRPAKTAADENGYTKAIEDAGAKLAVDTCMVVAPIKGRFKLMATDSAKACYYARSKHGFKTKFASLEECVREATK